MSTAAQRDGPHEDGNLSHRTVWTAREVICSRSRSDCRSDRIVGLERQLRVRPRACSTAQVVDRLEPEADRESRRSFAADTCRANEEDAVFRKRRARAGAKLSERHQSAFLDVPARPFVELSDVDDIDISASDDLERLLGSDVLNHPSTITDICQVSRASRSFEIIDEYPMHIP